MSANPNNRRQWLAGTAAAAAALAAPAWAQAGAAKAAAAAAVPASHWRRLLGLALMGCCSLC